MLEKFETSDIGDEGDTIGAVSYFLSELEKGPFAPALAGDALACYRIQLKLADFVKKNLADKVVLISNKELSPVARPALALRDKVRDPNYWSGYRLSSLHRVWNAVSVDVGALDRVLQQPLRHYSADGDLTDFERTFRIGRKMPGRIARRTNSGTGLIVDVTVDDVQHSCFLPLETLPIEDRNHTDGLVGTTAEFEVVSILPEKRSVWLRMIRNVSSVAQVVTDAGSSSTDDFEEIERKLMFVRRLHDRGLLPDAEYEAKRKELLARI